MPPPPEGQAFEPTLAIDPADPRRLIVAAMRGMPPVGTSSAIWTWRSDDGGQTWRGDSLASPRFPGSDGPQTFGADAVAAFGVDGVALLASMSRVGDRGGTFLSRITSEAAAATAVPVFENRLMPKGGAVLHDKPWLAVDRIDDSRFRGSVYLSTGALDMQSLPAKLGEPWGGPLITRVELAVSRDSGRTFSTPILVSDSAFSAQLAVTPGGVVEASYARLVDKRGAGNAIFHRRSTDGGTSFGPPSVVAAMTGDTLLDIPVLAARPNGDLLVCWGQGVRTRDSTNQTRCAHRPGGGQWSAAHPVDRTLPTETGQAWPAIVGTVRGWYLLQYVVTATRTEVILYRSSDGARFTRLASLDGLDGIGLGRFCLNSVTPCRRSRPDGFTAGDYVALTASAGRLAAAYVLPRRVDRPDSAAVRVVAMPEPAAR